MDYSSISMENNQLILLRIILLCFWYTGYRSEDNVDLRVYDNCSEAFASGNPRSREVFLHKRYQASDSYVRAFCQFNGNGTGYVFLSQESILNHDLSLPFQLESFSSIRERVAIQIFYKNGTQTYTILEQLDEYKDRDLTVLVNSYEGFAHVKNSAVMGDNYLYLGILDKETAANENQLQGFKSNGRRIEFVNCDGKPNSYFAFYPTLYVPYSGSSGFGLVKDWFNSAIQVPESQKLPNVGDTKLRRRDGYKFLTEVHFGGCGAFEISALWSDKSGTALGLAFTYDSCGDPGMVDGALREGTSFSLGSYVLYTCIQGYQYVTGTGSRMLLCSPEYGWTGGKPVCERITCVLPPEIPHATSTGGYQYKDTVRYSCDAGYIIKGNDTITCSTDKTWAGSLPKCRRIKCKPPPDISKAYWKGDTRYGDVITYGCIPGYHITSPSNQLVCTVQGHWDGERPVCSRITCVLPPEVAHATSTGSYQFKDTVTYSCDAGYIIKDNDTITCSADRNWAGSLPKCRRIKCKPPPDISKAHWEGDIRYGDVITYSCIPGYHITSPSNQLICTVQGSWDGEHPVCSRVSCGEPEYGWSTVLNISGIHYGDIMSYSCQLGYTHHSGDRKRICGSNGKWRGTPVLCKRITCVLPPEVAHATSTGSYQFKDTVRYSCDAGYIIKDNDTITCSADRNWAGSLPKCRRIKCKPPPDNSKAHWEGDIRYGDVITYSCIPGYHITSPSIQLICTAQGNWRGELPSCSRITCGPPGVPENAKYEGTYMFEDSVMFFCLEGYILTTGDPVHECKANGKWGGNPIVCKVDPNPRNVPVYCPPVPNVMNADWSGPDDYLIPVNTLVSYICDQDHEFPDGNERKTIACLSDGQWSITPKECRLKRCSPLPNLHHANISTSLPVVHSVHDVICHVGHEFPDGSRVRSFICLPNKKWNSNILDCSAIPCSEVSLPENVLPAPEPEFNKTQTGTPLVGTRYQCEDEMRSLDGLRTQTTSCGSSGRWARPLTSCKDDRCEPPPLVENATLVHYGVDPGWTVHFRCQRGSRFPNGLETHEITCLGRDWDETVVQPCSVTNCPVPPDVLNATLFAADYFYSGTVVKYKCDYGYRFDENLYEIELECLVSGSWDQNVTDCQIIICPDLEVDTGGYSNTSLRTVDTVAHVSCPNGKRFRRGESEYDVTCQITGQWTRLPDVCQDNRCPPVPVYPHATPSSLEVDMGSLVTITCLPGYEIGDGRMNFTIGCGQDLDWFGSTESCIEVYCGPAPSLPLSSTNQTGPFFGDSASISCDPGHEFLPGNASVTFPCQEDASWSIDVTVMKCQPLNCPPIPYVGNATPSGFETLFNTSITYKCLHGYWIPLNKSYSLTLRCAENGYWRPTPRNCFEIQCPHVPQWLSIVANATWRSFGTTVNYTCPTKMTFGTGATWRITKCTEQGQWSPQFIDCKDIISSVPETPKEAAGSSAIGTLSIVILSLVVGFIVALDLMTVQRDILILRKNLSYCFPSLAPTKRKTPPKHENLELLPLMRDRSRMYSCENNLGQDAVTFETPNFTNANSGIMSPIILKPFRLIDHSSIPYMEDVSGDDIYFTDSEPASPKANVTGDIAATTHIGGHPTEASQFYSMEPLLPDTDKVKYPERCLDEEPRALADVDLHVACPLAHEEHWEEEGEETVLVSRSSDSNAKELTPCRIAIEERTSIGENYQVASPSGNIDQSDNALDIDSVVENGSLAHFSPSTEPLV